MTVIGEDHVSSRAAGGSDPEQMTMRDRIMSIESVSLVLDEERNPMAVQRNSSWFSAYFNMTNTICGAGVLGMPYAFSQCGTILGCFFLFCAACFSQLGCYLIVLSCAKTGFPATVYSVTRPMHKHAPTVCDLLLLTQLFGAAVAYLIVIGDLMPGSCEQLGFGAFWIKRDVWVVTGFLCAMPLSIPHNIDFLKYSSGACIFFLVFVGLLVFVYSLKWSAADPCKGQVLDDDGPCEGSEFSGGGSSVKEISMTDTLRVLSIFIFGYCCQVTTFPIANELTAPTKTRLWGISFYAIFSAGILYFLVALCGYYTYGDSIKADLLLNYPQVPIITTARMMISFIVTFSYPLQVNPARRSALTLMHNFFDKGEEPSLQTVRVRYFGFTAFFLMSSLVLGLVLTDLGVVIQVIGATGGCMIMFILPGYCYLFHFAETEANEEEKADESCTSTGMNAGGDVYSPLSADDSCNGSEADALKVQLLPRSGADGSQAAAQDTQTRPPWRLHVSPCDEEVLADMASLNLKYEMDVPKSSKLWRRIAWWQMWTGIVICPLMLVMIFIQ